MSDRRNKEGVSADPEDRARQAGGSGIDTGIGQEKPQKRPIEVPPLYRRPAPDRDRQGCMKARA